MLHGGGHPQIKCCREVPERRIMTYRVRAPKEHSGGPMPLAVWIVAVVAVSFALTYLNSPGWIWIAAGAVALPAGLAGGAFAMDAFSVLAGLFVFCSVVLGAPPLRRLLVSRPLLAWYRGSFLPCPRPSRRRSTRARCGGTAIFSPAAPTGENCSRC